MRPFASLSHDSQTRADWFVKSQARAYVTLWVGHETGHASTSIETFEPFMCS